MQYLRAQLASFAGVGGTSLLVPRWLLLRGVGAVLIVVFAGIINEGPALVGSRGLAPLGGYLGQVRQAFPDALAALLHAPSVFWLARGDAAIAAVAWTGLAAAFAIVLNWWPRLALFICWLALLSFVATWQLFSATQVDQLMLEVTLLAIPFAPPGFRPGLGAHAPPRPVAVLLMRWLMLRVMFESGVIKLIAGDQRWLDLTALDQLFETAPFPTILGYWDHQLPHLWHVGEWLLTFTAELVAPILAVLGGRRGRWVAFAAWSLLQAGIQLTNNFGWLNTASLALGLLLLDDQMLASAAARLRLANITARLSHPPAAPTGARWTRHVLPAAAAAHCALTLHAFARVCGDATGSDPARPAPSATRVFAGFRSANAYTLYGVLLPHRFTVEFEGSNDGGETWRPFEFRYQPQRENQISPFIAPYYPRFEATLQVLANAPDPSPLYRVAAGHLLVRSPLVLGLFRSDPFPDRPPALIRFRGHRFAFTNLATQRATGRYWTKTYERDYLPMMFLDERGAVADAQTPLDEIRAQALHGNRAAQRQLGTMLAFGEGVARDLSEAARWFRRAADRGDADSQFFLGLCLAKGDGVPQNFPEAAKFYRLAALQGNVPAQVNLGFLLARGEGVARDATEALAWFAIAARSGQPEAVRVYEAFAARADTATAGEARRRSDALAREFTARADSK